jgi:Ca2+-binding RTX toxin-like protein
VVRQGHPIETRALISVVGTFLIGCAVLLVVGCSGTQSEAPEEEQRHTETTKEQEHTEATEEQTHSPRAAPEEHRCGGTRTFDRWGGPYITNDVPGCPNGGVLKGTDERDKLAGEDGEDKVHGLSAGDDFLTGSTVNEAGHDRSKDVLHGGPGRDWVEGFRGDDVLYGGDGDDNTVYAEKFKDNLHGGLYGDEGEDVLYGGDGNDFLDASADGQRDKLYCGKGSDEYAADEIDYVSSSCEEKVTMVRVD